MKTAEEMAMEYLGTDPRKRTGETLASLLLLYGAQVREEAAQIIGSCKSGCFAFSVCGHCQQRAEEVRKMELP